MATQAEIDEQKKLDDEAEAKRVADEEAKKKADAEAKKKADEEADKNLTEAERIEKRASQLVDEKLKDIKGKLDNSFAERDAARKELDAIKKKERDAELKALEAAGKHKEAFDIKLAEEQAKYADLESRYKTLESTNLDLSRNNILREELREIDFKNKKSADMAFASIASEIIKDDKGNWVHRSGVSIKEFVAAFAKDEENSFLIKAKQSSGSGTEESKKTNTTAKVDSLVGKSNKELLAMAEAGTLPKQR